MGPSCHSQQYKQFSAKGALQFPGYETLSKPHVFLFPVISVCMSCGFAEFRIQDKDLSQPGDWYNSH